MGGPAATFDVPAGRNRLARRGPAAVLMLKPKRLLYLAFDVVPAPGRPSQLIGATLPALSTGFQVDALTVKNDDLPHTERFHQVRLFRVPVGKASLLDQIETFGRAVRRQIESAEYDLVHCRSLFGMQPVWQRKLDLGYRIVHEVTSPPHLDLLGRGAPPSTLQGTFRNRLREAERQALLAADLILVPSARAERRLARLGLTAPLHRIRQGLDVDRLNRSIRPPDPRPLEILALGRLQALIGYEELLAAFARLVRRGRTARLRLVGSVDPEFGEAFQQTVSAFGLQDMVKVSEEPAAAELPALLAEVDVCVVPSRLGTSDEEGLPLEVLLFLAAGRATVAPRLESISEVVREERDGLLYTEGSVDELTRVLERVATDPDLRLTLGQSAWQRVRDGWDALAMGRSLLEAYGAVEPSARKVAARLGNASLRGGSGELAGEPTGEGRELAASDSSSGSGDILPEGTGRPSLPPSPDDDSSTTQRSRKAAAAAAAAAAQPSTLPATAPEPDESWEVTQRFRLPASPLGTDGADDLDLDLEPVFVAAGSLLGAMDTAPSIRLERLAPHLNDEEPLTDEPAGEVALDDADLHDVELMPGDGDDDDEFGAPVTGRATVRDRALEPESPESHASPSGRGAGRNEPDPLAQTSRDPGVDDSFEALPRLDEEEESVPEHTNPRRPLR
jgi:glycosyltransferase involved in cell wall biosynthesis